MPVSYIESFAEKTGKDVGEVERLYKEAKKIVEKEYGKTEKDGDAYYKIVTGVLKKMLGLTDALQFYICEECFGVVNDSDTYCTTCGLLFDNSNAGTNIRITKNDVDTMSAFLNIMLSNRVVFKDLMRYMRSTAKSFGSNIDK